MKRFTLILFGLVAIAFTTQSHAALILGVTIEDSNYDFAPRGAANTINESGFNTITGTHSKLPDNTMWLAAPHPTNPISPMNTAVITFDLGAVYDLDYFKVWNYNEKYDGDLDRYLKRGAKDVQISVAPTVGGSFTTLDDFVFNMATGSDTVDFSQTIDLSSYTAANSARLVRFTISSNYTDSFDHQLTGLSEVQFFDAVPEVSRSMLALLGATMIVFRRRRVAAVS